MPEPTTILGTLKWLTPTLLKLGPWALRQLPRNSPIANAIRITSEQYSTRLPALEEALKTWITSEAFQSQVESLERGALVDAEVMHVDLFLTTTGYGLGAISLEYVREGLGLFYSELYLQPCDSEHGPRLLGAKLEAVHRELIDQRRTRQPSTFEALPYRPPVETDTTSRAITDEDRGAETELDIIRTLIDNRQGRTALRLLAALQERVDRSEISAAVRFRFFVNKGVCHMLAADWDRAEQEFDRARTLEPANRKALINLAQVANFKGQHEAALKYLEPVLAQDPNDPNANALRFACLHELDRDEEIQEALKAKPSLANESHCLYTLAHIAFYQEKFDEAEHYLRRHNEQDDKHGEAWELLGRVIVVPAQRQLQETAASPDWIPAPLQDRIEEAEACFSRAEQLLACSESGREMNLTLGNRGVARTLLGRYDDARQDYEHALRIDPSLEEVKRNLGNLFLCTGRPQEAVHLFEQIESDSLRLEVAPFLAASYLDLKKPTAARELLEPLINSTPGDDRLIVKDLFLISAVQIS